MSESNSPVLAKRYRRVRILMAAAAMVIVVPGSLAVANAGSAHSSTSGIRTEHVCGPAAARFARCNAILVLNPSALTLVRGNGGNGGHRHPTTTTSTTTSTSTSTSTSTTTTLLQSGCTTAHPGYTPCDLQSAYNLPSASAGSGETVALVDAYNDPNAEADLAVYRSAYGLPACTTSNGCFRKVNQSGGTSYPRGNANWSEEISLDLDMVSATCPNCRILLVEASSTSLSNLGVAEDTAVSLGASAVSNSYGASEFSGETTYDSYYDHPGVAITASSGDSGYGVEWPAASPYVTAVGGTSLYPASGTARGWTESAWSGASSGCSAFEAEPSWQQALGLPGCSARMVADVSAVADPDTGVAVYDTFNTSGWLVFGGTSVASPIVASVYALASNAGAVGYGSYPYGHTSSLYDVVSGSNGSCSPAYLCTGVSGYDGPTGLGTPDGDGAF
ncbi:MAG: S53 family peptidase [Acidimicrobiales bacterium]